MGRLESPRARATLYRGLPSLVLSVRGISMALAILGNSISPVLGLLSLLQPLRGTLKAERLVLGVVQPLFPTKYTEAIIIGSQA